MATSGSSDFTLTRNQIITNALTQLGVYRPGATVGTNDLNHCASILNSMVKSWEGQGIHLWKETEGTLFLRNGINKYTLDSSSTDYSGDNVIDTTLSTAASGTSLTVTSTTGMTAADNIGIQLDDNTMQWTTIVSVNSSTSLTITASVSSTASSGNNIFTYTTHASKPLVITSARFRDENGTDRPIFIRGREEFMQIPNKTSTGKINQIFYAPTISSATIYVWPTPDSVADTLRFSYTKALEDFDSAGDNADFPTEWLYCITCNLAVAVAGTYGKKLEQENPYMIQEAQRSLAEMQLWDAGQGSTRIVPNYYYE